MKGFTVGMSFLIGLKDFWGAAREIKKQEYDANACQKTVQASYNRKHHLQTFSFQFNSQLKSLTNFLSLMQSRICWKGL